MTQKRNFLSLFSILLFLGGKAQEKCANMIPDNPVFEGWMQQKLQEESMQVRAFSLAQTEDKVYQIPVVVHIIHNGEPRGQGANITDSRVFDQIERLNQDFRRQNPDRTNTPPVFQPIAADTRIEFVPAKQDPNGNPTNGIVRTQGSRRFYTSRISSLQVLGQDSYWPPENYMNVYSLNLTEVIGYGTFPSSDIIDDLNQLSDPIEATLVNYRYFGTNPDAPVFESLGRTLTHEVGHFLGLRHIWGESESCFSDDFVEDTPLADDSHSNYGSPCTFPANGAERCSEVDEMFQNYMDYTNDICMNLFTIGQKNRMRIVLENSPLRASLLESPALNDPVGIFENDVSVALKQAPLVTNNENFAITFSLLNRGSQEVSQVRLSIDVNGNRFSESYNFMSFSTGVTQDIIYDFPELIAGQNNISISVESVNGGDDESPFNSNESFFVLLDGTRESLPLKVNPGNTEEWIVTARSDTLWERIPSSNNLRANGYRYANRGSKSWYISPILDASRFDNPFINFEVSYGRRNGLVDNLNLLLSSDGGNSYVPLTIFSSQDLSYNDTIVTNQWIPEGASWKSYKLNIPVSLRTDNLRVAFVFVNGNGNDLYMRDLEVTNFKSTFEESFKVFPNPVTSDRINLGFNLSDKQSLMYQLIDPAGKIVFRSDVDDALNQRIDIPAPSVNGIYYLRVVGSDFSKTEKIIIRR